MFSIFIYYFLFKKVKRVIEFTGHKYSFKQNLLFLEETLNSNGFLKKIQCYFIFMLPFFSLHPKKLFVYTFKVEKS